MFMKLVIATKNKGKIAELQARLQGLPVEVVSLGNFPGMPEVIEDGLTFRENAQKKAEATAAHTGLLSLADDSGLVIDAIGGEPGVYSARYAGAGADDDRNMDLVLEKLEGVPAQKRSARFVCDLALAIPEGSVVHTEGVCEGMIAAAKKGSSGFGYDPIFIVPELGVTMAEIPLEIKNTLSHRSRAIDLMVPIIRKLVDDIS
jgi:XTP/dITP diphosphohydrolase